MYLDANNLYGWGMSEKLPVNSFNSQNMSKFIEKFIKNSDKGHILEVHVEYPKRFHNLHNDLPFLPERMKIKKWSKLVCNLYDKNNYAAHIGTLEQTLNHGLIIKKVHKVIQSHQKAWLKSCIDMNIKLRTEAKTDFEKDFLNW